jgi:lipoprotein-releasing system ATP-binding protein
MSLVVQNLKKSFATPAEDLVVLDDLSLEVKSGETLAIVGPSGSGKSTLLQILGTLDEPTSGSVALAGQNPFALATRELADFRNQHIGFIFQDHHLLPQLSVLENTLIPALANRRATSDDESRAKELLDRVGLSNRLTHLPSQLSGGERERVAVARAMLLKPDLLLADEPTGNLDERNADTIADLLLDLQSAENSILIVVTHSLRLAERMQHTRRLELGKLVELATA